MRIVLYIIFFVLIVISCKVQTNLQNDLPKNTLNELQIRTIQERLLDYKQKMLYLKYDEAKNDLIKALDVDSTHPVVCYELSKFYTLKEKRDSAIQYINQSVVRDPDNLEYLKYQVYVHQIFGDIETTSQLYEVLLDKFPNKDEFWFMASDFYLQSNQLNKAYNIYDEYETLNGFNEQIVINKYKILTELKDFKRLNKLIENYTQSNPNNPIILELAGEYFFQQNKIDKGLKSFNKLLSLFPDNTNALLAMADYYRANMQFGKSFDYIQRVIDGSELTVEAKVEMLLRFMSIAAKEPKLEFYFGSLVKSLKEQYSNNADVQLLYANFLIQERNFEQAQKEFERALLQKPDNLQGWVKLIMVDNELNQNDQIIKHATTALEYFPNQSEIYYYRGISYFLTNQYSNAIQDLTFGNRITGKNDPLKFQFIYFLGEAHYKNNEVNKAFDLFDQALEINNQEVGLLNNYAYYLSLIDRDLDKARNMSLQTVKLEPNNSTYLDTYAWILFRLKDYQTALTYIEKAILNGGSSSGVIMEHYGDILFKNNRIDEALTAWKEAKRIGDHSKFIDAKIETKNYVE